MSSAFRATGQRLDALQEDLRRLRGELAQAWASPDAPNRVAGIETRISKVWDEIDHLAVSLGEPGVRAEPLPTVRN